MAACLFTAGGSSRPALGRWDALVSVCARRKQLQTQLYGSERPCTAAAGGSATPAGRPSGGAAAEDGSGTSRVSSRLSEIRASSGKCGR